MPSVQELKSKNARAVHEKHLDLVTKYQSHHSAVEQLHKLAKDQIVDHVASELELNDEGKARVLLYLSDFANLFRFYRRSRYNDEQAIALLNATVLWRMRTDLDLLSLSSLNPLYVTPPPPNPPLFWVNSKFTDFYGRPCGIINLRSVERTADNSLDQLKEYIVACMEMMRRYVADLYRASIDADQHKQHTTTSSSAERETVLQASIAVDLASSGMANLELELLPFLLDLLKNHVPGMVGAVYILNYGWVHAGMWAVIKRVLPQQALAKIFFPSHQELQEHFDINNIPECYGGELRVAVESSTNDVLRKYGRPRRASSAAAASALTTPPHSPGVSRHMSRTNSYDSIYEVFYSADSTPWASRPITPRHSEPSTPRGNGTDANAAGGLKMTPSAARKLKHLQMSRGDLSSAAEHAHLGGGRSRSGSEPRIVDGRAVGLSVSVGASPFVTPSMTPVGPLSPRVQRPRNPDRHVRFSSDRSSSPQRRVGATSNFTLYLPEDDEEAILPSESEDSDASGKDGELPPAAAAAAVQNAAAAGGGLFNKLRRLSETHFTSRDSKAEEQDGMEAADGTIMYIEPPSPRLQVDHLDEPPLQHVAHTLLSHRTRRSARDGHVSPYNANNPFFGYPAYNPSTPEATFRLNRSVTPQHLHSRRRKRDLLRTLTYLFVLRILAFHRRLRWRMSLVWREAARTLSVGASASSAEGAEDDFWRNLDARRLSALQEDDKRRIKQGSHGKRRETPLARAAKKLMGAAVLVLLLRPEWRRRTMMGVYAMFGSMLGGSEETGVDWDEWDRTSGKTTDAATVRKNDSWSGMHLRQRLGLKRDAKVDLAATATTAPKAAAGAGGGGGGGGKGGRGSRVNPLAVAGGLISAASLGYLLYTYLSTASSSKPSGGDDDDDVARRRPPTTTKPSSSSRPRPSLSLCLSPTFTRDAASLTNLRTLLTTICPLFVVHLVLPGSESDDLSASISSLCASLGCIADFDARRILEYTQPAGRFALSRALACDCHVEVALAHSAEQTTTAELAKIRRSCGLVVFACLASSCDADAGGGEGGGGGGRQVLVELRRIAQQEGVDRDAPNGMRAFDLGDVEQHEAQWRALGERLVQLREGWR